MSKDIELLNLRSGKADTTLYSTVSKNGPPLKDSKTPFKNPSEPKLSCVAATSRYSGEGAFIKIDSKAVRKNIVEKTTKSRAQDNTASECISAPSIWRLSSFQRATSLS